MNRVEAAYRELNWWQRATVQIYSWIHKLFCRDYDRAFESIVGRFKTIQPETSISELAERVDRTVHSPSPEERDQALELDDEQHRGSVDSLCELEETERQSVLNVVVEDYLDIERFPNLRRLKISGTNLGPIPDSVYSLTRLTGLVLKDTNISELSPLISQLTNLELLDLSGSQIQKVPNEVRYLPNLKELFLDRLPRLDRSLFSDPQGFKNLKIISFIDTIPNDENLSDFYLPIDCQEIYASEEEERSVQNVDDFYIHSSLTKLELNGTDIVVISPKIGRMTQLEYLNLNGSRIVELPKSIEDLQKLSEIHLDDIPQLKSSILETLTRIPSLKVISLQRSLKEEVDDVIFMLPKGCRVFLGDNPFSEEARAMLQRANLNEEGPIFILNSGGSEKEGVVIKSTPEVQRGAKKSVKEWPKFDVNVEEIDLSNNIISSVPVSIKEYWKLRILNLSDNKLDESVFGVLCVVKSLEELDLSNNNIESVPVEIANLKKLRVFNLHMTGVDKLPTEIWSLDSLEELDLSHNQSLFYDEENEKILTPFPEGVMHYKKLRKLDLSHCQLQDLPHGLLYLPDGCRIILKGNPLNESVRNYLKIYQGKLIFEL